MRRHAVNATCELFSFLGKCLDVVSAGQGTGNLAFKEERFNDAVSAYTQALATAPLNQT